MSITFEQLCEADSELLLRAYAMRFVKQEIVYAAEIKQEEPDTDYVVALDTLDASMVDHLHDDARSDLRNYVEEYAKQLGIK